MDIAKQRAFKLHPDKVRRFKYLLAHKGEPLSPFTVYRLSWKKYLSYIVLCFAVSLGFWMIKKPYWSMFFLGFTSATLLRDFGHARTWARSKLFADHVTDWEKLQEVINQSENG